jgi:hypothetical protein
METRLKDNLSGRHINLVRISIPSFSYRDNVLMNSVLLAAWGDAV